MLKIKIYIIFLLIITFPSSVYAVSEADYGEILNDYSNLYGDIFENITENNDLKNSFNDLIPDIQLKEIFKDLVSGKIDLSIPEIINILIKKLLGEVSESIKLMALIIALSLLCSYLTGLQDGFGKEGVNKAAFYTCYIIISGIACTAFYNSAECIFQAIENIAVFMKMIVPVVITTLVASGAIISASVFEPTLIVIVEITVTVIQTFFIPLVMLASAMNIVNNMSEKFKTEKLVKFINQCIKWGLTIIITIFVSVASIQSIASSGADGLTIKLTKYAASNLIPIVGGVLSESVETVMSCSALIKNSVGVMGIICVIIITVSPILKIGAILIIFRLTAAIAEPISDPKIVKCLSELGNSISVLFSILTACSVMFIIVLTVIINAGNTVVMLGR